MNSGNAAPSVLRLRSPRDKTTSRDRDRDGLSIGALEERHGCIGPRAPGVGRAVPLLEHRARLRVRSRPGATFALPEDANDLGSELAELRLGARCPPGSSRWSLSSLARQRYSDDRPELH